MTINIQNASKLNVKGVRTNGNCKPVFCITTGEVYTSALDAAEANGMLPSTMNRLIAQNGTSRSGKKFCYVAKVVEHLEEIAECNRIRESKIVAYNAITARQEALPKAKDKFTHHQTRVAELKQALESEMSLMNAAESEFRTLKENEI